MKEELSDFLKFAKEKDKIKELDEAFKEYPVKEEWHQGKIENILCEVEESYSIYEIGDIVFVSNYKYKDGTKGENHLFVIIEQNNIAVPIENFGMLISSKIDKVKYEANKLLKKDNKNNLNLDSIVKTDVIYRILNNQILFKIGKVDMDKIEEYKKNFYNFNNLK